MPKFKRWEDRRDEPQYVRGGFSKLAGGQHRHIAEIYGDAVTSHLRPWARRRVLAAIGQ